MPSTDVLGAGTPKRAARRTAASGVKADGPCQRMSRYLLGTLRAVALAKRTCAFWAGGPIEDGARNVLEDAVLNQFIKPTN